MRRGPKGPVSVATLDVSVDGLPSQQFARFCAEYLIVPKGKGVGGPLVLRPWQVELCASMMDPDPKPSIGGWMMPRGQAKTTLVAAWMVWELFAGPDGNQLVCVAVDERQAHLLFETAVSFVQLNSELESRCHVYRDRLEVPGRRSSFSALPAEAKRLEGLGNFRLACADEIGVIGRDTWETLLLGLGKVEGAQVIGIGTPSAASESVLTDLREYGRTHPDDQTFVWREYSADAFTTTHPVDCRHCWALCNPALGDFLSEDAMVALLPPKTREAAFRRSRLCQFVPENEDPFISADMWDSLQEVRTIPDGSDVVIALDGSHSRDCTALVVGTVEPTPHFDTLALFTPGPDQRIDVLAVEASIRSAAERFRVQELVADPFRWQRSLAVLASEGITTVEFPWSPSRITRASTDLHTALVNGGITHSGDLDLRRHMLAASLIEHDGGLRLAKASKSRNAAPVDLAAALLMAHSRCTWLASRKPARRRVIAF